MSGSQTDMSGKRQRRDTGSPPPNHPIQKLVLKRVSSETGATCEKEQWIWGSKKITIKESEVDDLLRHSSSSTSPELSIVPDDEVRRSDSDTDTENNIQLDPDTGILHNTAHSPEPHFNATEKHSPPTEVSPTLTDTGEAQMIVAYQEPGAGVVIMRGVPEYKLGNDEQKVTLNPTLTVQNRLDKIMSALMSSTQLTLDELSHVNSNEYYNLAASLMNTKLQGIELSASEAVQWQECIGFFFFEKLRFMQAEEAAKATIAPITISEYNLHPIAKGMDALECFTCRVGHLDGSQCNGPFSTGPHSERAIELSCTWRNKARLILISFSLLKFISLDLIDDVLNFNFAHTSYERNSMVITAGSKNCELFKQIRGIIELIGPNRALPIMLEFAHQVEGFPISCHDIIGFLRVVYYAQATYKGPIVVVVGPVRPYRGESQKSFMERKREHKKLCVTALAIGHALGVPVTICNITDMGPDSESVPCVGLGWRPEALYNRKGQPTREYYRRLSIWMRNRMSILNYYSPEYNVDTGTPKFSLASGLGYK